MDANHEISNNKIRVKVSAIFSYSFLRRSIWRTLCDLMLFFLYSETRMMLKLGKRARGHFVSLTEVRVYLITPAKEHLDLVLNAFNEGERILIVSAPRDVLRVSIVCHTISSFGRHFGHVILCGLPKEKK